MAKQTTGAGAQVPAKKEEAGLPAEFAGLEEFAGQGLEDIDSSDRSIPFVKVLEKNSPEIETVPGARPGMFINTATNELFDSIRIVPVTREHSFVEWVPIDSGGGLVASYGLTEPISLWAKTQRGKIKLKNGNDLVETFYLYCILLPKDEDGDPTPVVVSFTSTRIKAYKTIVNRSDSIMLRGAGGRKFKAPWFCHVWVLTSEKKVDGNQSWYIYKAEFDGASAEEARLPADHPVVLMGSEMVKMKQRGELKVSAEAAATEQPPLPERGSAGNGAGSDMDDPPF